MPVRSQRRTGKTPSGLMATTANHPRINSDGGRFTEPRPDGPGLQTATNSSKKQEPSLCFAFPLVFPVLARPPQGRKQGSGEPWEPSLPRQPPCRPLQLVPPRRLHRAPPPAAGGGGPSQKKPKRKKMASGTHSSIPPPCSRWENTSGMLSRP